MIGKLFKIYLDFIRSFDFLTEKIWNIKIRKKLLPITYDLTSLVIKKAIETYIKKNFSFKSHLDMGCGQIAILGQFHKKINPMAEVVSADIYNDFLMNAKENSKTNKLNIKFLESNMFSNINQKFDLIIVTHALEHITDVNYIFNKFNDLLNLNGYIFFEVPNCPKEYWNGRPYDGLHLLYYTKKSFEKLAEIHGLDFINFSFSAHSFENDRNYQIEDLKSVQNNFSFYKLKRLIKKLLPKKIARDLKDYKKGKKTRDKAKLDWFANNTGDNCYIRGILKKKLR